MFLSLPVTLEVGFVGSSFTGKIIRDFFLTVGKRISQLLNPFKLYIRKSLGTRTLFVLFSPFPLAFSMFSVGENEGKEGKTLSES